MPKYIDLVKLKHPAMSETDLELLNRTALLNMDKSINVVKKNLETTERFINLEKSSTSFNPINISAHQVNAQSLNELINELTKLKEELF